MHDVSPQVIRIMQLCLLQPAKRLSGLEIPKISSGVEPVSKLKVGELKLFECQVGGKKKHGPDVLAHSSLQNSKNYLPAYLLIFKVVHSRGSEHESSEKHFLKLR